MGGDSFHSPALDTTATQNLCNTCGLSLPTRNKLFKHIKETGHALRVVGGESNSPNSSRGQKKKKKQ